MKFVTPLTDDQREELEGLRREGATHRQRSRAHAVLLSAQGYPIAELAGIFGVERDALGRWLCAWGRGGAAALADRPRGGRPPKLAAAEQDVLRAAATASAAAPQASLVKRGA